MADKLLQVQDLEVRYHTREGTLTSIRNVSFDIDEAEILGVVGESGCGKTHGCLGGHEAAAAQRRDIWRTDPVPRPGPLPARRGRHAPAPGQGHRHDLPGCHDQPQPRL